MCISLSVSLITAESWIIENSTLNRSAMYNVATRWRKSCTTFSPNRITSFRILRSQKEFGFWKVAGSSLNILRSEKQAQFPQGATDCFQGNPEKMASVPPESFGQRQYGGGLRRLVLFEDGLFERGLTETFASAGHNNKHWSLRGVEIMTAPCSPPSPVPA